jgi:hypothetical protein
MVDHTYKIKTSKDDKNLEFSLNGIHKDKVNNDEKAKKLAQKESKYTELNDSVENTRLYKFGKTPKKENMRNNKMIAFSSIVE